MSIEVSSLKKEYNINSGNKITAVDEVDLTVGDEEFLTLVGPSGCGKTTTLRCIAGLEKPTSGSIEVNGRDVTEIPPNKRDMAMMFQNIALYPHMKVKDNISYPLKVRNISKEERYEKAAEAAEIMQIPDLLEKFPGDLSGGQQQRAALARTIVQEPVAFLMDEPLSDLDAKLKVTMRKEIQRIHKRVRKPTIYVTHDQEEAMTMSDRIAVMNDGRIEQIGKPDELYHNPRNVFVAKFLGMPSMNFLSGTIDDLTNNRAVVSVQDQQFDFSIDYINQNDYNTDVLLGFRPEVVQLNGHSDDTDLNGTVQLLERIGDRILATIEGPEGEIRATVSNTNGLSENETTSISVDQDGLYLFDRTTERLVAKGAKKQQEHTL